MYSSSGCITMILLSILMPTLIERREIRKRLLDELSLQMSNYPNNVELITSEDDGTEPHGSKMQRLISSAKGKYLCCIEDDDMITGEYLSSIMKVLDSDINSNVELVTFLALRTDKSMIWKFKKSTKQEGIRNNLPNGCDMLPNHFCVWKSDIAKGVKWLPISWRQSVDEVGVGADVRWYTELLQKNPSIVEYHLDKILYLYQYDPKITRCQVP